MDSPFASEKMKNGSGGNVQSSGYAAPLVMGLLFFTLLVVTVAVLSSKKRRNRLLSYADTCLRRLSSNNDGREALLQGATVSFGILEIMYRVHFSV